MGGTTTAKGRVLSLICLLEQKKNDATRNMKSCVNGVLAWGWQCKVGLLYMTGCDWRRS